MSQAETSQAQQSQVNKQILKSIYFRFHCCKMNYIFTKGKSYQTLSTGLISQFYPQVKNWLKNSNIRVDFLKIIEK